MEQKIGVQIAKLRKEQEITQTALAEYLAVSPQAVSRWENGVSVSDVCLLPQIAAFFDVSIDELFGVPDFDEILFLVKKYSSDRNDVNYQEAMRYLNMELKGDDGNLKLLALKLHMLLQRSREYHEEALKLCEALIPMARRNISVWQNSFPEKNKGSGSLNEHFEACIFWTDVVTLTASVLVFMKNFKISERPGSQEGAKRYRFCTFGTFWCIISTSLLYDRKRRYDEGHYRLRKEVC